MCYVYILLIQLASKVFVARDWILLFPLDLAVPTSSLYRLRVNVGALLT